jgi:hypothetical protein
MTSGCLGAGVTQAGVIIAYKVEKVGLHLGPSLSIVGMNRFISMAPD